MRKTLDGRQRGTGEGGLGVWLIGARGGLATTLVAGVELILRDKTSRCGLVTETPAFAALKLRPLERLVFGGHEVRKGSLYESAMEIHRDNGTIPYEGLLEIRDALDDVDTRIREGTVMNCGDAIRRLAGTKIRAKNRRLADIVKAISADLEEFRRSTGVERVIVVNLASTEPPLNLEPAHRTPTGLQRLIKNDVRAAMRASGLYAWAAIRLGMPFLNFTPSNACLTPGHVKLATKKGVPVMGNDGKTGETLVKSALAPMFKYRNFRVLTWQGYNILGDRDGQILADPRNRRSKIQSKDGLLSHILGYPLNTHVSIEYAPSLSDLKTAWDFVHFQGFLDYKMSLQFTWQGCDAILAAPIVLDMVRLADHAQERGEAGLMTQLACFFKSPLGVDEHDLHFQFHHLMAYLAAQGASDGA